MNFHLKLAIGIIVVFGLILAIYYCYEPIQFTYYKHQLASGDPASVDWAVRAVAEKGKRAIPYIRKWLGTEHVKLIIGSCKVLENMPGDDWQAALPELENILRGIPSETTDAAAAVVYNKKYACVLCLEGAGWLHFKNDLRIKQNICIYVLRRGKYDERIGSVRELRILKDRNIVSPIINSLEKDKNISVRIEAAKLLGEIGDERAIAPLIRVMETDKDFYVCVDAIYALRNLPSLSAVRKMLDLFSKKDSFTYSYESPFQYSTITYIVEDRTAMAIRKTLQEIMPSDFPIGDENLVRDGGNLGVIFGKKPKLRAEKRKQQVEIMLIWLNENESKLVWDAEKKRYFLSAK
jgi:hypothetical protein